MRQYLFCCAALAALCGCAAIGREAPGVEQPVRVRQPEERPSEWPKQRLRARYAWSGHHDNAEGAQQLGSDWNSSSLFDHSTPDWFSSWQLSPGMLTDPYGSYTVDGYGNRIYDGGRLIIGPGWHSVGSIRGSGTTRIGAVEIR